MRHSYRPKKTKNPKPNYVPPMLVKKIEAKWVMALDDFENGWGEREYPRCTNCHRGVYKHDAGNWCPFCGASMKNPMRY